MQWIEGPPNETGLWIVVTSTRDYAVWEVSLDRDELYGRVSAAADYIDEYDEYHYGPEYLRFSDGYTSEPMEDHVKRFPPWMSFGPIPRVGAKTTAIHSANIARDSAGITKPRPYVPGAANV